jgi:molybdopterin-guanine dinucleotide biosynthesis protein A
MPNTPLPLCSILLLAGGRGQRMGGADKGLQLWQGRPMIAWLHDLVRPHTDDLILSCNRNQQLYAPYADHLVSDAESGFPGPLAGIRAGLQQARHSHVLILPCDAPLLDRDILQTLLAATGERPVVVRQAEQWQPLFSLWPRALLTELERAWTEGQRSPLSFLRSMNAIPLDFAEDDPRLSNLNTPALLEQAAQSGSRHDDRD